MCEVEKTAENLTSEASPVEAVAPVVVASTAAGELLCQAAVKSKSLLQQAVPATQDVLTRVVYNGSYYLAFGVTFPALFAVRMIPGGRRLVSGFVDGAHAASQYLDSLQAAKVESPVEAPAAAGENPAAAYA